MDIQKMQLVDVEQVAENTPAEVLDGWDAYYRCEPFGEEQFSMAKIEHAMRVFMAAYCGAKKLPDMDTCMPYEWVHRKQETEPITMEDLAKRLEDHSK